MNGFVLCTVLLFGFLTPVISTPALLLTPYILKNQTVLARNLSRVDPELFLNVTSYSGFLTVDEKHNSNLFFWYFPVKDQEVNADTPWITWLQGGPGATSLAGLFSEFGPFMYDSRGLKAREWTWNRKYPLLFIDSPVGAGFSFTDSPDGFVTDMDQCSEHLYSAVQQFLELFPEHRSAPLYLAGESYAGHYLPALGHAILHPPTLRNLKLKDSSINLKGIMMGNPVIDREDIVNMTSMYYQWGLIDSQGVEAVRPLQEKYAKAVLENNYKEALNTHDLLWDKLERRSYQPQSYNAMEMELPEIKLFGDFVKRKDVKEAIHVGDIQFTFSNSTVHVKLIKDFVVNLNSKVEELLENYRIMIYCGQLDLVAPCTLSAEGRRKRWRWSGRKEFLEAHRKPWWHEAIAGYVKSGGNFTEVLVRGAGHIVPMDKPAESFELIDHFIRRQDLPLPAHFKETDVDAPSYIDEPLSLALHTPAPSGLIASVVLNAIFVAVILAGVVLGIRWKRSRDTYFYSLVDNASLNGVLTMD